eukprot:2125259-Amphidinium_carterae.1
MNRGGMVPTMNSSHKENQYVAGFMSLAILDQDGYARKTKGSQTEAPFHLRIDGDNYILESVSAQTPPSFTNAYHQRRSRCSTSWVSGGWVRSTRPHQRQR